MTEALEVVNTPMRRIYLDHNATTPLCDPAREAILDAAARLPGNPSSVHVEGQRARAAVERARRQVATLVGGRPGDVVFTSGATEAINWVHRGLVPAGRAVVTTVVEHTATLAACRRAVDEGRSGETVGVAVDALGRLDLTALGERLDDGDVGLVSVMLVNNEIGNRYPLGAIAELCRSRGVLCHTDASQAAGRIPLSLPELGVDLASLSAHKLYGPKGVGALWLGPGAPTTPWQVGGHQERGRRPGTENLLGIVGFGAAAAWVVVDLEAEAERQRALRDRLRERLIANLSDVQVNGDPEHGAPNTLNLSFLGCASEGLLIALDLAGVSVSAGSACSAGSLEPSHVIKALTGDPDRQSSAIRFSLGRGTSEPDIDEAVSRVINCVRRIRRS